MLLFTLAWISLSAFAGPPKAVTEITEKVRYAVLGCYNGRDISCASLRKKLEKECKPAVKVLQLPFNATPEQAQESLVRQLVKIPKGTAKEVADKMKADAIAAGLLPAGTPTFILGHGVEHPNSSAQHLIATYGKELDTAALMEKLGPPPIVTEKKEDSPRPKPMIWVSACRGGTACDKTEGYCVGAICQGSEDATYYASDLDPATRAMAELYCDEEKFNRWDENKDGEIGETEMNAYFCGEADGGRPYVEFMAPGSGGKLKANIALTKEMATLQLKKYLAGEGLLDEADGEFSAADRKRLAELEAQNVKQGAEYEEKDKKWKDTESKNVKDYNAIAEEWNAVERRRVKTERGSDERKKAEAEQAALEKKLDAQQKVVDAHRATPHPDSAYGGDISNARYAEIARHYAKATKFKGPLSQLGWKERQRYVDDDTHLDNVLVWEFPPPAGEKKACIWRPTDKLADTSRYFPNVKKAGLQFYPGSLNTPAQKAATAEELKAAGSAVEHQGDPEDGDKDAK